MSSTLIQITEHTPQLQKLADEFQKSIMLKDLVLTGYKPGLAIVALIIGESLTLRGQNLIDRPACPECGHTLESKGLLPRSITCLVGLISWKRQAFRCSRGCKIGIIIPSDIELGLAPNQRTSDEVKQLACLLAVFIPYNISMKLFEALTCITVSSTAIWQWVRSAGGEAIAKLESELKSLNEKLPDADQIDSTAAQLPLTIGGDGVMVPFRPAPGTPEGKTVWKEVKVGILARPGKRINKKGKEISFIIRRRLVAVLGGIEDFKLRMQLASVKAGILEAPIVVWLSDGGHGYQGVFYKLFSGLAIGILDYYHAAQNLWKGAEALLDGRTQKAKSWFAQARQDLRKEKSKKIIDELKAESLNEELPKEVQKTLKNQVSYLETHSEHICYDHYKEPGLPIGSGIVESACKWLIQQRFKCVGMRWSINGFNNLLHLRLAWLNGTFDELYEKSPPK